MPRRNIPAPLNTSTNLVTVHDIEESPASASSTSFLLSPLDRGGLGKEIIFLDILIKLQFLLYQNVVVCRLQARLPW